MNNRNNNECVKAMLTAKVLEYNGLSMILIRPQSTYASSLPVPWSLHPSWLDSHW